MEGRSNTEVAKLAIGCHSFQQSQLKHVAFHLECGALHSISCSEVIKRQKAYGVSGALTKPNITKAKNSPRTKRANQQRTIFQQHPNQAPRTDLNKIKAEQTTSNTNIFVYSSFPSLTLPPPTRLLSAQAGPAAHNICRLVNVQRKKAKCQSQSWQQVQTVATTKHCCIISPEVRHHALCLLIRWKCRSDFVFNISYTTSSDHSRRKTF